MRQQRDAVAKLLHTPASTIRVAKACAGGRGFMGSIKVLL
jgi:hypothetical protein